MKFVFYIGATGTRECIDQLHNALKVPGSRVRPLVPKEHMHEIPPNATWVWRTKYHLVSSNDPANELEAFLRANKPLLSQLNEFRLSLFEAGATILVVHDEGEEPRGFWFSPDCIRLLSGFGADLNIDAVYTIKLDDDEQIQP
jgi:hypothetical protein